MISPNQSASSLFSQMVERAASLRVEAHQYDNGAQVIDCGINCKGGIEAGLLVAQACIGDLGQIALNVENASAIWPTSVQVTTSQPVAACLGCQYAGWSLEYKDGDKIYRAMASGPGRLVCRKEKLINELDITDTADLAVFILESDRLPPEGLTQQIAADCKLDPGRLRILVTPTVSLAGSLQIAARIVEVALHKAHELKFPLNTIVDAIGSTPLPPPIDDFLLAMGRTNDTILFGGFVHLYVDTDTEQAKKLAAELPSNNSRDYGTPFAELFKRYDYDFFKVDPLLFSPATVMVTSVTSGESFRAGKLNETLLKSSFGV